MKTFEEAVNKVMASGVNFQKQWDFTTDVVENKRLKICFEHAIDAMLGDRESMIAGFMAAFELGMATGIEMEKNENL